MNKQKIINILKKHETALLYDVDEQILDLQIADNIAEQILKEIKAEREKLIKVINEIPINYYKGRGFGKKNEPLIEKSKVIKALKE